MSYEKTDESKGGQSKMYSTQDIEAKAIALVNNERVQWEDATVNITEKVSFRMRDLIRTCRKNYYGVFDKQVDPLTGRKKIWYPLTEELVDAVAPKIRIRTRDINFRAKSDKGYGTTEIVRAAVTDYLWDTWFGEDLDELQYNKCIDGTSVIKTWMQSNKIERRPVDLLNIYIDPSARNIQEAYRVTERALMFSQDIQAMAWRNKDVDVMTGLNPNDPRLQNQSTSTTKTRDVYEMWGKIPKSFITADPKDDCEEIDGRIIVSGLEGGEGPACHLIEKNTIEDKNGKIIKPYEEDRYIVVPGRWYGKGIAEKVVMLQVWVNAIINIRINRAYVAQLGLFKIRKGANITPQQISRLGANGAVLVNNMDDIEQLVMQEASQASYTDESNIRNIAQRLTSAFEVVTGESLPASTPATNAVLQDKNASTTFGRIQERAGMFAQRWIDRHILPKIAKQLSKGSIVRYVNMDDKFDSIIERVAVYMVGQELEKSAANNQYIPVDKIDSEIERVKRLLRERQELFFENMEEIVANGVDTHVFVTNEDMDVSVKIDKLMTVLQMTPEYREPLVKQIYDLLGIAMPGSFKEAMAQPAGTAVASQGTPENIPSAGNGPAAMQALGGALGAVGQG